MSRPDLRGHANVTPQTPPPTSPGCSPLGCLLPKPPAHHHYLSTWPWVPCPRPLGPIPGVSTRGGGVWAFPPKNQACETPLTRAPRLGGLLGFGPAVPFCLVQRLGDHGQHSRGPGKQAHPQRPCHRVRVCGGRALAATLPLGSVVLLKKQIRFGHRAQCEPLAEARYKNGCRVPVAPTDSLKK